MKTLAENRQARRDYEILETFEAGLVLFGHEVRAVKEGKMSLNGSFAVLHDGEAYLINASIAPYQPKNIPDDYDAERSRKLLLHKRELNRLQRARQEKNLTTVPLKVYTKNGVIKVEIATAKGLKRRDRREQLKKRDMQRDAEREVGKRF